MTTARSPAYDLNSANLKEAVTRARQAMAALDAATPALQALNDPEVTEAVTNAANKIFQALKELERDPEYKRLRLEELT